MGSDPRSHRQGTLQQPVYIQGAGVHQAGDGAALKRLLSYNVEDLRGMQHIKRHLSRKGVPL